jgi:hypothetical protein
MSNIYSQSSVNQSLEPFSKTRFDHSLLPHSVLAQERLDRITACVSEMSLLEQPSPMVKVSSRGRMASPSRDPDTEEDPNEWMDSAIPVDEVLGNTLTSQGFRIEDRPRSPSVPRSPNSMPASPATSPTGRGGARLEVGLGKGLEAEGSEYRVSRFSDVSLSDVGGDRELRSEPSLVEMVVGDTEGGIPVESTGTGTENGTESGKAADLLQQGLGEVQGPPLSVPTTVPEDRPLVETSENRGRSSSSLNINGRVEAQKTGEEQVGSTESGPASTSGRGVASESGQYKTKRPPAIAVSHPTPLSEPQVRPGPAENETEEDRKVSFLEHSNKSPGGSSEVANGSQKIGVGGKSGIREDDIASDGSEAFATQAEQTPSTAASVRPSVHHARVNSVDSAYR